MILQLRDHMTALPRRRDDEGMTLIELLIAVFILAVAILALAASATASLTSLRTSRDRDRATAAASAALEAARQYDYHQLAMDKAGPADFDHNPDDAVAAEPTVRSDSAPISPYSCSPTTAGCWFDFSAYQGKLTVSTYVTWYDDPELADSTKDGKRVTASVTWTEHDNTREVRQSTVVAEADRGLGIPDFEVTQKDQAATAPPETNVCFDHLLQNFGAADTYDFWVEQNKQSQQLYLDVQSKNHEDQPSRKWRARAWLGPNADDEADAALDSGSPETYGSPTRMKDSSDGDPRLESQTTVAHNESVALTICYSPLNIGSGAWNVVPQTHTFDVKIRSHFETTIDPSATGESLTHTITVDNTNIGLFLKDDLDDLAEKAMRADTPTRLALPDYDTTTDENDPNNPGVDVPGWYLARGSIVRWSDNSRFLKKDTPVETVTVEFWTSWRDAILYGTTQKGDLAYEVQADVFDGATPIASSDKVLVSYSHTQAGWLKQSVTLTFASGTVIPENNWLRIAIGCVSPTTGSGKNCHVAYDTEQLPAQVTVHSS